MSTKIPATLIAGDGIGPEIMTATTTVLDALGAPFEWDHQTAGLGGVQAVGDPLPKATLDNPTALLLAAAMMLDHCKMPELATRLRSAIDATLNPDQVRTSDLAGKATTGEFTRALIQRIEHG